MIWHTNPRPPMLNTPSLARCLHPTKITIIASETSSLVKSMATLVYIIELYCSYVRTCVLVGGGGGGGARKRATRKSLASRLRIKGNLNPPENGLFVT